MAPPAAQRATFKKYGRPDPGTIMDRILAQIENDALICIHGKPREIQGRFYHYITNAAQFTKDENHDPE